MKFFNTAGLIDSHLHYFIPLEERIDLNFWRTLILRQKYFVLHAPRQSGKTTLALDFVSRLNQEGVYKALYVNVEVAAGGGSKVIQGLRFVLSAILNSLQYTFPDEVDSLNYLQNMLAQGSRIHPACLEEFLQYWSMHNEKPLVLFIDEIDALAAHTLLAVLRQLCSGYAKKPKGFPQSICLLGVRDVRDYRLATSPMGHGGGSAFNIKAESLVLPDFSLEQVSKLYLQHTLATGQKFSEEADKLAFSLTGGQPWLVNALAYQVCFVDVLERKILITREHILQAKETMIKRKDTHIDVLLERLLEPRVRYIIDAILAGKSGLHNFKADDLSYVRDLGLVSKQTGPLAIANPIYQEIIPRELVASI